MVIGPLKQIGKVKKPNKCWPHELTKKKNFFFEGLSSPILCNSNKVFLEQIILCNEK